jgi:hypothetical protein
MSIEGRIAVDVSFADSATSSGVQSLKKITLTDTTSYTTGKVAIVTGTCGTAAVSVNVAPSVYEDASGNAVSLRPARVALAASPAATLSRGGTTLLHSAGNRVAVTDLATTASTAALSIQTASGTAAFSVVVAGEAATVPGAPTATEAFSNGTATSFRFLPPSSNGGSAITGWLFYAGGDEVSPPDLIVVFGEGLQASWVDETFAGMMQVAAVNAVGVGEKSLGVDIVFN